MSHSSPLNINAPKKKSRGKHTNYYNTCDEREYALTQGASVTKKLQCLILRQEGKTKRQNKKLTECNNDLQTKGIKRL